MHTVKNIFCILILTHASLLNEQKITQSKHSHNLKLPNIIQVHLTITKR